MATSIGDAVVRLGADTAGLEAAFAKLPGIAGKAGEGIASKFAAVLGPLSAGAAIGGVLKIGETFETAFDQIRVQTGQTGPALAGLEDSFKQVFAAVPNSAGDAAQAIGTLNQRLGLTGAPLQNLSTQILNLSRVTKTDLASNVQSAADVFNNWGISAQEQGGKLDELFRASQATGISVQDLESKMSSSGVVLREVGLSFEQSAALLGTLNKAGVDSSAVMPAMSKALAVAAKQGKDAQTVFSETFNRIKNAPSDTAAAGEALTIFGAKAGPRMAALIREGKLSFDDLAKSISSGGDTINKAASDTERFPEKLKIFGHQAMVAIEPLASALLKFAGSLLERVGPALTIVAGWIGSSLVPAVQNLVGHLGTLLGPLAAIAKSVFTEIAGGVRAFVAAFKAGGDDVTSSGFAGALEKIGLFARHIWDYLSSIDWGAVFSQAEAFIAPVVSALMNVGKALGELAQAVIQFVQDHWTQIQSAFETAVGVFERVATVVRTGLADALNILGGAIRFVADNSNVFLPIVIALTGAFVAYKAVVGTITVVQKGFEMAQKAVNLAMTAYQNALKIGQAIQKAFTAAQWLLNAAMDANPIMLVVTAIAALVAGFILAYKHVGWFRDIVDAVGRAIKAFVTGAIDFLVDHWKLLLAIITGPLGAAVLLIIDNFGAIKDAIVGFVTGLWDAATSVIDFFISLPGKILSAIGNAALWLVQKGWDTLVGFLTGITNFEINVANYFLTLVTKILGWLGDAASWLITTGWNALVGFLTGVYNFEVTVAGYFTSFVSKVLGWLGDAASWLIQTGVNVLTGLYNGIVSFEGTISGYVSGFGGKILGWIGDLSRLLWGVGEDIVAGLRDGIVGAWHWVTDKVSELIDKIPGPIRKLLGISSPSKVMAEIGLQISSGLALGIGQGAGLVSDRMAGLAGVVNGTRFGLGVGIGGGNGLIGGARFSGGGLQSINNSRTVAAGAIQINIPPQVSPEQTALAVSRRLAAAVAP